MYSSIPIISVTQDHFHDPELNQASCEQDKHLTTASPAPPNPIIWAVYKSIISLAQDGCGLLHLHLSTWDRLDSEVWYNHSKCIIFCYTFPRSGELQTQKLKSNLVRTQSLNVLPLKPGEGQYTAIQATLTARDFSIVYFYPSGPFTCTFSKTSPNFFVPVTEGLQNKIGHPAWCRFPSWVPMEYK